MSVSETQITASRYVLIPMGDTDVLATLDTHSIVMEEHAEVVLHDYYTLALYNEPRVDYIVLYR